MREMSRFLRLFAGATCLASVWALPSPAGQADVFRGIPDDMQLYDIAREKDKAFKDIFEFVNLLRWPSGREIEQYRMRCQDDKQLYERTWRNICPALQVWLRKDFVPHDVRSRAIFLSGMRGRPDIVVARWETQGASFQFTLSMGNALLVVPPPDSISARTPVGLVSHVAKTYFDDRPQRWGYPPDRARIVRGAKEEGASSWNGLLEYQVTNRFARRVYWWTDMRVVAFFAGRIERIGGGFSPGNYPPQPTLEELRVFRGKTVEWRRRRHVDFTFEKAIYPFGRPEGQGEDQKGLRPKASRRVERRADMRAAAKMAASPTRIESSTSKPETTRRSPRNEPSGPPEGGEAETVAPEGMSVRAYVALAAAGLIIIAGLASAVARRKRSSRRSG